MFLEGVTAARKKKQFATLKKRLKTMLVGSGDLPQIFRSQAMAWIPNTPSATTFVTASNKETPRCPSCSGQNVKIVCYGWVCRPCKSKSPPQRLALAQSFGKAFGADAKLAGAAMTQCQPEGRGGSQRAEPYSSLPTPPWDPTIHDGRRRWSQEWCVRMDKCGGKGAARNKAKGTGTKGSGQMVSDEVMADSDEEMACRTNACLNALSGLQDAVYKAINMPARAKSPTF